MKQLFFLLFISFALIANSQIDYVLRMSNPQTHYFEVEMKIKNITEDKVEIKMPVWAPGSYLVRDFSKNVNQVKAFDANGKNLKIYKTRKNAWVVENGNAKNISVKYEVYAFELSVRTSFLDLTHGFVSGTGVFMYSEKFKNQSGRLTVVPHATFSTISTALIPAKEDVVSDVRMQSFEYQDYDELADAPIEIGNQKVFEFTASSCKHTVAMYGEGNYNIEKLKVDMAKIVDASTSIYGEMPNEHYVFIIHNVSDAQGGLEHKNSTTLSVNRNTYSPENYNGFLTLVAHEYFHLWNVKRLRAKELGPFNYDEEVYTPLLYVMEGFTAYYEDLIVHKAGFTTQEEYLKIVQGAANYVAGNVGSSVQPVADASFDAWIKAYKPNENSQNTTVSYYSGGGMIASLMDALIIAKFDGKKTLDDFMRSLYQKYYKAQDIGFTNDEFEREYSAFMGEDMNWFFENHVRGTELPDYEKIYGAIGIKVENVSKPTPNLGISLSASGVVRYVRTGSPAEKGGLSVYDEIVALNGVALKGKDISDKLMQLKQGETVKVSVLRDNVPMNLELMNENYTKLTYSFSFSKDKKYKAKISTFLRG